jgi:hypothetical protein
MVLGVPRQRYSIITSTALARIFREVAPEHVTATITVRMGVHAVLINSIIAVRAIRQALGVDVLGSWCLGELHWLGCHEDDRQEEDELQDGLWESQCVDWRRL